MNLRHGLLALILLFAAAGLAHGASLNARQEASQLVAGTIAVDPQGAVTGYTLDEKAELSDQVRAYLGNVIPKWRFEPVLEDGKPVAARSDMSLRLVLKPAGNGNQTLSIGGVHFGSGKPAEGTYPKAVRLNPPKYPTSALYHGGTAAVYLLVKVGRDGSVEDAVAEQVNLHGYATSNISKSLRADFEKAAIKQAKGSWRFQPPTLGEAADDDYWTVRVPVIFAIGEVVSAKGAGWSVYEPGPRRQAPWATPEEPVGFSPDALPGGGAYLAGGGGLRLLPMGGAR